MSTQPDSAETTEARARHGQRVQQRSVHCRRKSLLLRTVGQRFFPDEIYVYGRLRSDHRRGFLRDHRLDGFPTMDPIDDTQLPRGFEVEASISLFAYVPKRFLGVLQSCAKHDAKVIHVAVQTQLARELLHMSFHDISHSILLVFQLVRRHP